MVGLLENMSEKCTMLRKARQPDGEGGFTESWAEDFDFMAAIARNTSMEAKIAEKMGVTSVFHVVVDKGLNLAYNDVFRRERTGETFRVTSDGEVETPKMSALNLRSVTAEKWRLPL